MAVAGAGEITAFCAAERTRNNAADMIFINQFTGYFTELVQSLQTECFFMAGNLENTVGRGIEDRFAGFYMLFAKLFKNNGP